MNKRLFLTLAVSTLALSSAPAWADSYSDTIQAFRKANQSASFFSTAYGYAVFPTIGKGGAGGVGGAYGRGRVYEKGRVIGDVSMTQLAVGPQLGAQGYSQIVFFENKAALDTFTKGEFEFGADAAAVAVTAGAGAKANTAGSSASASTTRNDASVAGAYRNGMALFTIARGGLMAEATVNGQKFRFKPRAAAAASTSTR